MPFDGFAILKALFLFGAWLIVFIAPLLVLTYATYFLITVPLRRRERARLFLDLLETGFEEGKRPENLIVEIAQSKDRSLGIRFHLLAAHIESGLRLGSALEKVPRFLPPQIVAMFKAGEELGNLKKIFPACRSVLQDTDSQVKAAFNYLILAVFVFAPVMPSVVLTLKVYVFPKFIEIFAGYPEMQKPFQESLAYQVFAAASMFSQWQLAMTAFFYLLAFFYIGGPRVSGWGKAIFGNVVDAFQFWMPWRRRRIQRDFAQMLAVLLDCEVPEPKAVELAADSTNNGVFRLQANKVIADLAAGKNLQDALKRLSHADSFQWRLKNAFHSRDFVRSLTGWFEFLEAKAFQQEQAAAHVISTAFVVANGILIGLVVIGIFQMLVLLLNEVVLW